MMFLAEKLNLQPASFRGVPFFVRSETTKRGQKTVVHEYPNTDIRFVEPLGKLSPIFTLQAFVHGETAGQQRTTLENALDNPEQGLLIHPVYGRVTVSVVGGYDVYYDETDIGVYRFDITFAESRDLVVPALFQIDANSVSNKIPGIQDILDAKLKDLYEIPLVSNSVLAVSDKAEELWTSVQDAVNIIPGLQADGLALFNRTVRTAQTNISSVVKSADKLVATTRGILDTAAACSNTISDMKDAWQSIAETAVSEPFSILTPEQLLRAQDIQAMEEHLKLSGVSRLYEAVVHSDFLTDTELTEQTDTLNALFIDSFYKKGF